MGPKGLRSRNYNATWIRRPAERNSRSVCLTPRRGKRPRRHWNPQKWGVKQAFYHYRFAWVVGIGEVVSIDIDLFLAKKRGREIRSKIKKVRCGTWTQNQQLHKLLHYLFNQKSGFSTKIHMCMNSTTSFLLRILWTTPRTFQQQENHDLATKMQHRLSDHPPVKPLHYHIETTTSTHHKQTFKILSCIMTILEQLVHGVFRDKNELFASRWTTTGSNLESTIESCPCRVSCTE